MSQKLLSSNSYLEIINRCEKFYGLSPNIWKGFKLIQTSSALWIINNKISEVLDKHNYDTAGLRIFSGDKAPYKPTFAFFSFFNKEITKGYIELSDEEANSFIHRENIILNKELQGYHGVKNRGLFVGVGLGKGNVLLSQVPKKIGNQMTKI